jgi:hypothetical protein
MEVKLAVLADYSNISREGKLNLLGIFDIIRARSFPAVHPNMQLVVTFEAPPSEAGTNKNVQVRLMDADGKRILEVGTHLKLPQPAPGGVIKSNHILNLNNVAFENPGDYAFYILINGEEKRSVPLKLVKIEQ